MYFLCRIITLALWRVLDINKCAATRRNQAPAATKRPNDETETPSGQRRRRRTSDTYSLFTIAYSLQNRQGRKSLQIFGAIQGCRALAAGFARSHRATKYLYICAQISFSFSGYSVFGIIRRAAHNDYPPRKTDALQRPFCMVGQ